MVLYNHFCSTKIKYYMVKRSTLHFLFYLITKCSVLFVQESYFSNELQISFNRKYPFSYFSTYCQKYFYKCVRVSVCACIVCVHVWVHVYNTEQEWRLEDNLWESVISCYHMSPMDQIQAVWSLVANDFTLLAVLPLPRNVFLLIIW